MRKVYKVVGTSNVRPYELPRGLEVVEKMVGEVHQVVDNTKGGKINFVEATNGDVVIYKEGISGSNLKISHDQLPALIQFLNQVWIEHRD